MPSRVRSELNFSNAVLWLIQLMGGKMLSRDRPSFDLFTTGQIAVYVEPVREENHFSGVYIRDMLLATSGGLASTGQRRG